MPLQKFVVCVRGINIGYSTLNFAITVVYKFDRFFIISKTFFVFQYFTKSFSQFLGFSLTSSLNSPILVLAVWPTAFVQIFYLKECWRLKLVLVNEKIKDCVFFFRNVNFILGNTCNIRLFFIKMQTENLLHRFVFFFNTFTYL